MWWPATEARSSAWSYRQQAQQPAYIVGERIRRAIEEMPSGIEGLDGGITVSIGIATCPEVAATYVDLVARADEALYRGKALGKNRVCLAIADA